MVVKDKVISGISGATCVRGFVTANDIKTAQIWRCSTARKKKSASGIGGNLKGDEWKTGGTTWAA